MYINLKFITTIKVINDQMVISDIETIVINFNHIVYNMLVNMYRPFIMIAIQ